MGVFLLGLLLLLGVAAAVAGYRATADEGTADLAEVQVTSRPLSRGEDRRRGSWKAVAWTGRTRVTGYGRSRADAERNARLRLGSLLRARSRTTGGAA